MAQDRLAHILRLQERAEEIRAQLKPVQTVPMLKPESDLKISCCEKRVNASDSSSPKRSGPVTFLTSQVFLRRKLGIINRLIRKAMIEEIDRRGWYVRDGEIYPRLPIGGYWCGTLSIDCIESYRTDARAVMKKIPGITIEEALVEVFRRRDREYEHGDVPTFRRREPGEE